MNKKRSYLCLFLVGLLTFCSVSSALAASGGDLPEFLELEEPIVAEAFLAPEGRSAASDLADYYKLPVYYIECGDLSPRYQYGNTISRLSGLNDFRFIANYMPYNGVYSDFETIYELIFSDGYDSELLGLSGNNYPIGFQVFDFNGGSISSPTFSGVARIDSNTIRFSLKRASFSSRSPGDLVGLVLSAKVIKPGSTVTCNIYVKGNDASASTMGGDSGGGSGSGGSGSVT